MYRANNIIYFRYFFSHLLNSSHIEDFAVLSEEAIAKGIRRIIATTGEDARRAVNKINRLNEQYTKLNETVQEALKSGDYSHKILTGKIRQQLDVSLIICRLAHSQIIFFNLNDLISFIYLV